MKIVNDIFQVYNREQNIWESDNISLMPGWSENFVLDKTTDTAKIKLKYKGSIIPNWNNGDWCRIIHLQSSDKNATYNKIIENGKTVYIPKNHEQYIIKNPIMVYDELNGEIDIQLELVEPIEITNGIICETMSFTNQIEKTIDNVIYIHDKLNHLNVLEKILKITPANNDINKSWYSRIKILNSDLLNKIAFNDDTFSEPTLYDILMNKYDSSVGRTPVMYFDINGETDKPFNLERTEYVLDFIRQDGLDKPVIDYETFSKDASQIILNKPYKNKADGIVSNIDNLATTTKPIYISDYLWAIPEVNSNERIISTYDDASEIGVWILKLPFKIKQIIKLTRLDITVSGLPSAIRRQTVDLTNNVLEESQYTASDNYNKRNVIWFKQGENIIHLNDFYFNDRKLSIYRVEYQALNSMRYDNGKDFQTIVNQVDGQIAEDRLSKYLKEYQLSMNKSDIIVQKTIENWNKLSDIGQRVIDGDKTYIITNVSIQNRGYDYDIVYQLNENHIRKSDSITAPQNIRKNVAIGYDALADRKTCLIKNYGLSLKHTITGDDGIDKNILYSSLISSNVSTNFKSPQLAYLTFKSDLKKQDGTIVKNEIKRLCTLSMTTINNTFCFTMIYYNNAECGKQKKLYQYIDTDTLAQVYLSPKEQVPILYTDGFGEIQTFDLRLIYINGDNLNNVYVDADTNPQEYLNVIQETNKSVSQTTNYPLVDGIEDEDIVNIATINGINYFKDMLDMFNYTIGFKVDTDDNIILCKAFFKRSYMFDNYSGLSYVSRETTNLSEEDLTTMPNYARSVILSIISENQIVTRYNGTEFDYSTGGSVVYWNADKEPVMIINDIDKVNREMLSGTSIKINC